MLSAAVALPRYADTSGHWGTIQATAASARRWACRVGTQAGGRGGARSNRAMPQACISGVGKYAAAGVVCGAGCSSYHEAPPGAEFFAMDRLIVVAEGPQVHFYRCARPVTMRAAQRHATPRNTCRGELCHAASGKGQV